MGGGGGGSKKKSTPPPQAEPINYAALMAESSKAAKEQFRDQVAAQLEAYPKQEALQLGTVSNIASNLSGTGGDIRRFTVDAQGNITGSESIGKAAPNQYTARATDQLIAAAGQADDLQSIADYTDQLGFTAAGDLQGTDIERELQAQATRELQLGRSLTPEQQRMAQQSARAGMAARGLGVGTGALAAEILNRDMFASQREADRRNFAGTTNQMLTSNRQNRLGLVGNILGQSANTRLAQANLRTGLAGAEITIDPYARALAPGAGMGSTTLGQSGQMIGNTYNNATQMAGNVASFNANMLESRRNNYQNNRTSLEAANIQAGASRDAGNSQMMGAMAGASATAGAAAALCWIARACMPARWRTFRRSMLRHAPDQFIAAYCRHGQRLASHLTTPIRRLAARLTLRTLEWSWT